MRRAVLRQLGRLSEKIDQKLDRRITRYGRHYLHYVLASLRYIDTKGLATAGDSTPRLDEIYIDVSLVPRAPHQVGGSMLAEVPAHVTERHSIWELVDRPEAVVLAVIGAPGSGKTTLLRHVARRVVQGGRNHRRPLPILLELRDHAEAIRENTRIPLPELLRNTLPTLASSEPNGWWEEQLLAGRCTVLLDGLDEVAHSEDRVSVARWISYQVNCYPQNDFVVTSRPHGYRTAVIDAARVVQVRSFTDRQIRLFLHNWYLAAERRATDEHDEESRDRADKKAADLLQRIAVAPALYDLAVNPLLLTMIANVHRYRGALPGSRADLYSEVCQVMLWRRQEAKRLPIALSGPAKERLLAQVAFTMMNERVRDLSRTRLLELVSPGLRRISTAVDGESFIDDVSSNGLLIEREKDLYAFAHQTLQEFLAARHIQQKALGEVLMRNVDDVWWRETSLLFVAGADADDIVRACLASGKVTALSLAFDCTENESDLAPELRNRLDDLLAAAFLHDTAPEHRRLVAGVLATRHTNEVMLTLDGSRVCPRPIPEELYRLFLHDTRPELVSVAPPAIDPQQGMTPAKGVWANDVEAFVFWLNTIVSTDGATVYRLPTEDELDQLREGSGPATDVLTSSTTSAWVAPQAPGLPRLWPTSAETADRQVPETKVRDLLTEEISDDPLFGQLLYLRTQTADNAPTHPDDFYGAYETAVQQIWQMRHLIDSCIRRAPSMSTSDADGKLPAMWRALALTMDFLLPHLRRFRPFAASALEQLQQNLEKAAARRARGNPSAEADLLYAQHDLDLICRVFAVEVARRQNHPRSTAARGHDILVEIATWRLTTWKASRPSIDSVVLPRLEDDPQSRRRMQEIAVAEQTISAVIMNEVGLHRDMRSIYFENMQTVATELRKAVPREPALPEWTGLIASLVVDHAGVCCDVARTTTRGQAMGLRQSALLLAVEADLVGNKEVLDLSRELIEQVTVLQVRHESAVTGESIVLARA
ncbi:NACHT domain-containing protein [Amycolatopsis deserti]|nr:NACHT domain-containing protein [Amycolatopsis deserti]